MKSIFYLDLKRFINFLDCSIYILVSKKREREIVFLNTELLIICISPSEQGKKYGSFLIKESLKNFKEFFSQFNGIFVKTLKKDLQNIAFYEKNKLILETNICSIDGKRSIEDRSMYDKNDNQAGSKSFKKIKKLGGIKILDWDENDCIN